MKAVRDLDTDDNGHEVGEIAIRKLAIDWIVEIFKESDHNLIPGHDSFCGFQGCRHYITKEELDELNSEMPEGNSVGDYTEHHCCAEGVVEWIKYFFGITNEEIKEASDKYEYK